MRSRSVAPKEVNNDSAITSNGVERYRDGDCAAGFGSDVAQAAFGATVAAAAPGPKRLAWLYVPNGVDMASWKPATVGGIMTLTPTLQPLAAFKDKFTVISGLACTKANPNGDGPGDHARRCARSDRRSAAQERRGQHSPGHLG